MSDDELRDAYSQAVRDYEAAKAGHGDRVAAFAQLLSTERALISQVAGAAHQVYGPEARCPAALSSRW